MAGHPDKEKPATKGNRMANHISKIQCDNMEIIARHRIDSGYYESPAVIDETVRRLQLAIAIDQEAEQAEWDAKNDGERWDGQ